MSRVLLLIGTQKGAFIAESNLARTNWRLRGPLMKGWEISDVQLDARGATPVLYAAVNSYIYGPTINRSHDLGETWEQIEHGPKYAEDAPGKLQKVWCIVPGANTQPEVLYAGVADAGIFVSRDGGNHWQELKGLSEHPTRTDWVPGAGGMCCHSILVDPANPKRIWVGISAAGVLRSDDGGETWNVKNTGLDIIAPGENFPNVGSCVHRMILDPRDPNRLFQQNHCGFFRSDDGAESWQRMESGLPGTFGFGLAQSPRHPDMLFTLPLESQEYHIPTNGMLTVYRSSDGAHSWHPLRNGLPDNTFTSVMRQALACDPLDPPGVYFGTSCGQVFCSNDAGASWQALPAVLPRVNSVAAVVIG
jgi:photosystem II stability/assembly factor-like uncharacterized protein